VLGRRSPRAADLWTDGPTENASLVAGLVAWMDPIDALGERLATCCSSMCVCVYVCMCVCVCMYECMYVCMLLERERVCVCVCVCARARARVFFVECGESFQVVQGIGLANVLLLAYRPGDDLFTHVSFFTCQRLAPSGVFHQQVFHAYQLQLHMGYLPLRGTAVFATFSTGKAPLFATRVGMFHDMFV